MKNTFLVLLVIACLAATVWTGYLLLTNKTDPTIGFIILLANIGVLIWNISLLKKYRVGAGTVIFVLLLIALLGTTVSAFAGVQPLSTYKDNAITIVKEGINNLATLTKGVTSESTKEALSNSQLHGTYTATVGYDPFSTSPKTIKRTLTFKEDTFTSYDDYLGKTICKYFIPGGLKSGQVIIFTNVATGEKYTERFKYNAEYDCFTIGEGYSAVTYYK